MATRLGEVKPLLRGQLHRAAFYTYIIAAGFLIYYAKAGIARASLAVYLFTLINLYGVSTVLHVTHWCRPWLEVRLQKIDHASIFLLISGNYTPICLCCLPAAGWVYVMLLSVWTIAIAGVIKCLVWTHAPKAFNVAFYFTCGLTIVPFVPRIMDYVTWQQMAFYAMGGAMYLAGGVIYGIEYPDPFPKVFGFHEIFHVLTIVANLCFIVPMSTCIFR
jgi:hemolysin III